MVKDHTLPFYGSTLYRTVPEVWSYVCPLRGRSVGALDERELQNRANANVTDSPGTCGNMQFSIVKICKFTILEICKFSIVEICKWASEQMRKSRIMFGCYHCSSTSTLLLFENTVTATSTQTLLQEHSYCYNSMLAIGMGMGERQ